MAQVRSSRFADSPQQQRRQTGATEANLGRAVRYRGFVLIPQTNLTWLIRPERSPMTVLPFRAPASSLRDVQALVDWRLSQEQIN
jgi:hypothetical protein